MVVLDCYAWLRPIILEHLFDVNRFLAFSTMRLQF